MPAEVLHDLLRAKATFQLRAIVAAMGVDPSTVHFVSPPCQCWSGSLTGRKAGFRPWVRPVVAKLDAGSAEGHEGAYPDAAMGIGS